MENAHVLIRLRDCEADRSSGFGDTGDARSPLRSGVGVRRTSATSVRLEHSDLSPGVASISFEQVFDDRHTNAQIFAQSLDGAVARAVQDGTAMTVVATGAAHTGKSFSMHGSEPDNNNEKGLIQLAIERAFGVVSAYDEWQVLLVAGYTHVDKVQDSGSLLDAFTGQPFERDPADSSSTRDNAFLDRALRVSNVDEAARAYKHALEKSAEHMKATDFVCVLYVESRDTSKAMRRTRLCFVDINGNSIIEPMSVGGPREIEASSPFTEAQYPVNGILSEWCGEFVGNVSSTFHIVTIQSSTKKQQLAIQALLYACKAKEIRSVVQPCRVESLSTAPSFTNLHDIVDEPEDQDGVLMFLGSPVSSVSSIRSPTKRDQSASNLLSERLRQAYHSVKMSASTKSVDVPPIIRTDVSSDGVASSPGVTMQTLHTRADTILSATGSSKHNMETMTLLDKLDCIAVRFRELEKSFHHEASVKKKCVERISKLSQTMSFQVIEHEKQLKARDKENEGLKIQLQNMQSMYDNAEQTLESLQVQVEGMKASMRQRVSAKSPEKASSEHLLLQQFSARLETAMLEAKAVVDIKDAVIRDLEASVKQLQDAKAELQRTLSVEIDRFRDKESRWAAERIMWEDQKTRWANAKTEWEAESAHWVNKASEWQNEKASLMKDKEALEKEKEQWRRDSSNASERFAQWTKEQSEWKKTQADWIDEKAKWNDQLRAMEAALLACREQVKVEQKTSEQYANRLAVAEQSWADEVLGLKQALDNERQGTVLKQNSQLTSLEATIAELENVIRMQENEIVQARGKLEALETAKISAEEQVSLLQAKLEEVQSTSTKEKQKLEKKLRILMSERKQQLDEAQKNEREMTLEVQRLRLELKALESESAIKKSELEQSTSLLVTLREQSDRLERQCAVSEEQIAVLQDCNNKLEMDKQAIVADLEQLKVDKQAVNEELEQRTYALEQQAARQLVEQEAKLASDYEQRVRDLMERHSSELLQRDLELRRLRNRRTQQLIPVSSSSSSSSSSSDERFTQRQHDLDDLGAAMDTPKSIGQQKGKRLEDKITKLKQKVALLRNQVESLTHALAVANEQESLSKEAMEQQQALYTRMMYAQDELQTQVNTLKEENWSLNLALQVTEKRGHPAGRQDVAFLPMSSRIAEC